MEALDFLKEYKRMCGAYKNCFRCPLKGTECSLNHELSKEEMINIVDKTEQWSKEHPLVTNRMKIREVFGEIEIKDLFNCRLKHGSEDYTEIEILEAKWWDKPYKEPEHEN